MGFNLAVRSPDMPISHTYPLVAPLYRHQEHKARDARMKRMGVTNWWVAEKL